MVDSSLDEVQGTESPDEGSAQSTQARPAARVVRRASLFDDPLVRMLGFGVVGALVLFLATLLGALAMGILGSGIPQTALERDLQGYAYQTEAGSKDPEVWKGYVSALLDSGQNANAQRAVDKGIAVLGKSNTGDMAFAQTQVYYSTAKYDKAIKEATAAMKLIKDSFAREVKTSEVKGLTMSDNYWGILYLRAQSHVELKQWDKALKDFDEYLKEKNGASDVYVMRAEVKLEMGDKQGAIKDYRAALKYLPDYDLALDGLKKLGVDE